MNQRTEKIECADEAIIAMIAEQTTEVIVELKQRSLVFDRQSLGPGGG